MKKLIYKNIKYFLLKIYQTNFFVRRFILLMLDILVLLISTTLSFHIFSNNFNHYINYSWIIFCIPILAIPIYLFTGQYKGITKYFDIYSLYSIWVRNLFLIILLFFVGWLLDFDLPNYRFGITLITNINIFITTYRVLLGNLLTNLLEKKYNSRNNIVIYGAGSYGTQLASYFKNSNEYRVIFFVDDSPKLWGRKILGITIHPKSFLKRNKRKVKHVLITFKQPQNKMKKVLKQLFEWDLSIRQISDEHNLMINKNISEYFIPFHIKSILGREIISSQISLLEKSIKDNVICVTGAGGSIGSELSKQLMRLSPKMIIMLENNEPSIYKISQEIKSLNDNKIEVKTILGNACDEILVDNIFDEYAVDVVFHCAAYKHVPLLEDNPIQGLLNNICSTENLCKLAKKNNIKKFILISSDKAVRPTNIMGASKRVSELIVQAYADSNYESSNQIESNSNLFSIVRFGNVLGSSGSVIPLFEKQISIGGPVTVTHKDIIRYFMTIGEAVQLVIQSASMSKGGDIFLLDMGEPIRILSVAEKMIKLNGYSIKNKENPDGDIEIIVTGLRPGEKLYEELLIDSESIHTEHDLIFRSKKDGRIPEDFQNKLATLIKNLKEQNLKESIFSLSILVPEWSSSLIEKKLNDKLI